MFRQVYEWACPNHTSLLIEKEELSGIRETSFEARGKILCAVTSLMLERPRAKGCRF